MILERYAYTPKGTFGHLWLPGRGEALHTVEQPWRNNTPSASCIPIGTYGLSLYFSPSRQREVILLHNNALLSQGNAMGMARSYIEMHSANWAHQLEGCIAPGMSLNSSWGVNNSRDAMKLVMLAFKGMDKPRLIIRNAEEGGIAQ